jgi:hypothetical protein
MLLRLRRRVLLLLEVLPLWISLLLLKHHLPLLKASLLPVARRRAF